MAEETSWYEASNGATLAQGELTLNCPVPRFEAYTHPLPPELDAVVDTHNLVILSQSCDLENDKIDEVLLALVVDYKELVAREGEKNPTLRSSKWRRAAVNGDLPAHFLLPESATEIQFPWSIVDFHHLFTLSKSYLEQFLLPADARFRLVPPYREHLAQAFARYVMRVGLPSPLHAFESLQI